MYDEIIKLLSKPLPIDSEERENILVLVLEYIDTGTDGNPVLDKKILGKLQGAVGKLKPQASDSRLVLEQISKQRKGKI